MGFLRVSETTSGFGRNQIYLKLKLETLQFLPGIKNLILIFYNTKKFHIDGSHCITILLGKVLIRSAPTTFHIIDVDDFSSINVPLTFS
jgi:hypothetical protein